MGDVVLGIDPASTKIAFVALGESNFIATTNPKLGKSGGQACANARKETIRFLRDIERTWPGSSVVAYMESAVVGRGGVRTTMVQCYTSGAIQSALYEAGVPTKIANVSSWKKRVVGKGNATKEQVAEHLRLRWPSLYTATSHSQDLIDAACIAIFGRQLQGE